MKVLLNSPLDMHLHLREGDMLEKIAKYSANNFSGALVMPNLTTPITTKEQVIEYKNNILKVCNNDNFTPYMTLFFKDTYNYEFLSSVKNEILAIKLYPSGITTNSSNGVKSLDIENLRETLEAMSKLEIPLCIHGESNGFVMDREKEFAPIFESLATEFPKLKIIMEHITDKSSVDLLDKYDNLYATITLLHLLITLDDVAGGMLQPHLFCKPIAKTPIDRDALLHVALNAHPKVMFGSDSAPHPRDKKENCGCAAGVFSAPVILPCLVKLFDKHDKLENLNKFLSLNAQSIYNIIPNKKDIEIEKKEYIVPNEFEGVVPFASNEDIGFSVI